MYQGELLGSKMLHLKVRSYNVTDTFAPSRNTDLRTLQQAYLAITKPVKQKEVS